MAPLNRDEFELSVAQTYGLTRNMARLLTMLVYRANVPYIMLDEMFGFDQHRTVVHKLRTRLRQKGSNVVVNTLHSYGYYLNDETRACIKKAIGDLHAAFQDCAA